MAPQSCVVERSLPQCIFSRGENMGWARDFRGRENEAAVVSVLEMLARLLRLPQVMSCLFCQPETGLAQSGQLQTLS